MGKENIESGEKDFTSVSPSAKALLLMKGTTSLPYMRKAAELISLPEQYVPDYDKKDMTFWARTLHFEMRYKSIDILLQDVEAKNILELSSGFSFRGLAAVQKHDVHYIDTDLPELIETKKKFIAEIEQGEETKGKLEVLPLNAIDGTAFKEIVGRFEKGPLAIVNEGLLMYLTMDEKRKLCGLIREALQEKGGCWITADVYVRVKEPLPVLDKDDKLQKFFDEHNVEENKFADFETAEAFFRSEGFVVDKEDNPEYKNAEVLPYLMASLTPEIANSKKEMEKMQATWRLKLA